MTRRYDPTSETIPFYGQGAVLIAERDALGQPKGFTPVGIIDNGAELTFEVNYLEIPDTFSGGRGVAKRLRTEVGATFTSSLFSVRRDLLSMLLHGTGAQVTAGTATDEAQTVYSTVPIIALNHIGVSSVVIKDAATGLITYDVDDDYTVNDQWGSINIVQTGAIQTAAEADPDGKFGLEISYSYAAYGTIAAVTADTPERWVRIEGIDTANSNAAWVIDIYRLGVDVLESLLPISDELTKPTFSGSALADGFRTSGSPYIGYRGARPRDVIT